MVFFSGFTGLVAAIFFFSFRAWSSARCISFFVAVDTVSVFANLSQVLVRELIDSCGLSQGEAVQVKLLGVIRFQVGLQDLFKAIL